MPAVWILESTSRECKTLSVAAHGCSVTVFMPFGTRSFMADSANLERIWKRKKSAFGAMADHLPLGISTALTALLLVAAFKFFSTGAEPLANSAQQCCLLHACWRGTHQ